MAQPKPEILPDGRTVNIYQCSHRGRWVGFIENEYGGWLWTVDDYPGVRSIRQAIKAGEVRLETERDREARLGR